MAIIDTITNDFAFAEMSKEQFIQSLIDKDLAFGWYNGEFVVNPNYA